MLECRRQSGWNMKDIEFPLPSYPQTHVTFRWSKRAKRLHLRVSEVKRKAELIVPYSVPAQVAVDFAVKNAEWIYSSLERIPHRITPVFGGTFPLDGIELTLRRTNGETTIGDGGCLSLACEEEDLPAVLGYICKQLAQPRLQFSIDHYCRLLQVNCPRFRTRDTTTRWASCSERGNLSFSWRLVMMPPEILDHVVAHEVCHLVHLDHSPSFRNLLAKICPSTQEHSDWLKANGAHYMRYDLH